MKDQKETETNTKNLITKEKYDYLWNHIFYACFGLTLVGIFYMIKGVNNFRNQLISLNPTYEFSKYSDFLICFPLFLVIHVVQHYTPKLLRKVCEKVMKKAYRFPKNEKDRQLGEKYKIRLPIHIFKGSMYTFLTIFGYYVLKDINYYPKSLLGKGWLPNMFIKGYPDSFYLEKPPLFDFYYMLCLSYFISDLVGLFREAKQTDFINMLLHHICTISLIVFSHLVHYSNVGSIVLILHMESDIFVHITRFFLQTDVPEIIKNISGLILVFNFLYTRIYVLGDIIYVLYMYVTWKGIIDWFLLIFLSIIYIMHINWAIMLLQKMFALFMGTKLNDTRDFKVNINKEKEKKLE
jgi:ceramide synthetase